MEDEPEVKTQPARDREPPCGGLVATAEDEDEFGPIVAALERCSSAQLRALASRMGARYPMAP